MLDEYNFSEEIMYLNSFIKFWVITDWIKMGIVKNEI